MTFVREYMVVTPGSPQLTYESDDVHFQPTQAFLLSGVVPTASAWLLFVFRAILLYVLVASLGVHRFAFGAETYFANPEDAWAMVIRTLSAAVTVAWVVYLFALVLLAYTSPVKREVMFEPPPVPLRYLVVWNAFNTLAPLTLALATYSALFVSDGRALYAPIHAAAISVIVDIWFGSYAVHPGLVTIPLTVSGLTILAYVAFAHARFVLLRLDVVVPEGPEQERAAKGFRKHALYFAVLYAIVSMLTFVFMAAKNNMYGVLPYKRTPKKEDGGGGRDRVSATV